MQVKSNNIVCVNGVYIDSARSADHVQTVGRKNIVIQFIFRKSYEFVQMRFGIRIGSFGRVYLDRVVHFFFKLLL